MGVSLTSALQDNLCIKIYVCKFIYAIIEMQFRTFNCLHVQAENQENTSTLSYLLIEEFTFFESDKCIGMQYVKDFKVVVLAVV